MEDIAHFTSVCELAAREAGQLLLDWRGRARVTAKAPADLVTEADFAAQQRIREIIEREFPAHDFLGEEDDASTSSNKDSPYRWIVDPLDGTTNYVHGLPYFCVSVAVEHLGKVVAGTVFDPVHDDCFRAGAGQGAYRGTQRIHVSDVRRLCDALVVTGFGPRPRRDSAEVRQFLTMLDACQAVRRMGAAALNMCYLAAGHLDAYWASSVKTWDVAAGLLIIREAGGLVTGLEGADFNLEQPRLLAAATPQLHEEVLRLFDGVTAG